MAELHPSLKLPEPFIVQKFLQGLGSGYEVFQTTFNQTHDIIPGDGDEAAVTFNATSLAAINEERRTISEQMLSVKYPLLSYQSFQPQILSRLG